MGEPEGQLKYTMMAVFIQFSPVMHICGKINLPFTQGMNAAGALSFYIFR